MNRTVFWFSLLVLTMLSLSCETTTSPSSTQKPVLTASENPITIALNFSRGISVSGGTGSYRVKSISDSGIVDVTIYLSSSQGSLQSSQYVNFIAKKLGFVKVVIQDSAKSAEVEISVTVAVLASTPSAVKVRVNRTAYVSFMGGISPYALEQNPNGAIAAVTMNMYSMDVKGVTQGATSVVIRDNSSPPYTMTIPIEVTPEPKFTTAGKISFSSSIGNFSANGISTAVSGGIPPNNEGAGGWIYTTSTSGNFVDIFGYKKKSSTIIDIIEIVFVKSSLTPGTLPIDSTLVRSDTAFVLFVLDGDVTSESADIYVLHSGVVTLTAINTAHVSGTFSGDAVKTRDEIVYPGSTATVTDGTFDVPLLVEDFGQMPPTSKESAQIKSFIEKNVKKEIKRMMKRIER